MNKVILFHAQGNANVRATALAFAENEILSEFHTSIACYPHTILDTIASIGLFSEIRRRSFSKILKKYTFTSPYMELARLISLKGGIHFLTVQEKGFFCVEAVIKNLDKKVAKRLKRAALKGVKSIYAYEDGAFFSFIEAKKENIICLYDLPTGYWRAKKRILELQRELLPEWQSTMTGLFDSQEKLERKDNEIELADYIIVASSFTALTLKEFPGILPPIKVIPYGFPPVGPIRNINSYSLDLPIKLLFIGSLSQQKGIVNLFNAVNEIGDKVSLTIVGRKPLENCNALNNELAKHRWIPTLSHSEILEIMREHDVLVFPTLFDGFGLVITEAMSQGTPVIATHNSAGPDLIEHDKNGWLVGAGSTKELQTQIQKLIANPILISSAGIAAMETAKKRPWSVYKQELSKIVMECMSS